MNVSAWKSIVKKGVCCLLLPCFLIFAFSGCGCSGSKDVALKCKEHEMSSEEFLCLVTNTIIAASSKIDASQMDESDQADLEKLISEGSIEGQPAVDWIKENAVKSAKSLLAVRQECKKLNQEVSDEDKQSIKSSLDESYDGGIFSDVNITKEAMQQYAEDQRRCKIVNDEYFAEGKPKYIEDERVDEYSKEHGLKYKIVELSKLLDSPNIGEEFTKALKNGGVSSVKELAEKYMDQIKKGKTIDDINTEFNKLFGAGQTPKSEEPSADQNFMFKYDNDNESVETKFVAELEPGAKPALKEDENAYYIIQRFELDQATIEKQRETSRGLLSIHEFQDFLEELASGCEITENKEVIDKIDILEQTRLLAEGIKKLQEERMKKMSQDQEESDEKGEASSQDQEKLPQEESSSQAAEEKSQKSQSQPQEQKAS